MIEQEPLASAHTRALSDMSLSLGKEHKSKTSNSIVCIKQINTQLYRGMHRFGQKEGGTDGCRLFFDLVFSRKWCLLYGVYLPPWWTLPPKFKWILDRFQPVWRMLKILGSGNFCENRGAVWKGEGGCQVLPACTSRDFSKVLGAYFLICPSMGSCSQPLFGLRAGHWSA